MKFRSTLLPLFVGLAAFPSIRYVVLFIDGPDTEFYGFPLPWNSRGIASSMTKDIYLVPLTVDIIFYLLLTLFVSRWLANRATTLNKVWRRTLHIVVWVYGTCFSIVAFFGIAANDLYASWWYTFPLDRITGVALSTSF